MHLDAGSDHGIAVVEDNALGMNRPDHVDHVLDLVRSAHKRVRHLAAGHEVHLAVLQMEAGIGK